MSGSTSTTTSCNVVITGANRGIGLSLTRLYLSRGCKVFAVCRQPSKALTQLCPTPDVITPVDISQANDIVQLQQALAGIQIDILINNAGVLLNESLGNLNREQIQHQFEVNALGPLFVTDALRNNLHRGSKVALITSRMGSIADNTSGGRYGYRMSKAALNAAGMSLCHDLKPQGVAVALLHPGLVGTDMIGGQGDITPDQAAERLATRIDELTLEHSGTFWHSNGEELPW